MTKSKKITNLFLALAFSCFTCGAAVMATLPSISAAGEKTQMGETEAAVSGLTPVTRGDKTFYKISSADELVSVTHNIANGVEGWASANYELTADITLSGKVWTSIGTQSNPYSGYFNGNGHLVNGVVSTADGSYDNYCGLFGYVSGAHIYDFVLGEFTYTNSTATQTSGNFIGYAQNSVLVDIYDMKYIQTDTPTARSTKTIGTMKNCTYYIGDTFYRGSGSDAVLWRAGAGYNYDANHGGSAISTGASLPQFDWSVNDGSSCGGYSIMVLGDATAKICEQGSTTKTDIGHYRILINTTGDAVTGAVVSENYYNQFASENILADVASPVAAGQPAVQLLTTGKKLVGWKSGIETTGATTVKTWFTSSANKNLWVEPIWKDLSYNIQVVRTVVTTSGTSEVSVKTIEDVPYNKPWSDVVSQITRSGYDLTKLYNAKIGGASTTAGLTYYTAAVNYDSSYNKTITETLSYGNVINHWDGNGEVDVKIYSDWLGSPVNTVVDFNNTHDSGLTINGAVSDITVAYAGTAPAGAPTLAISQTDASTGKYTFKAIADQALNLKFKLKTGYKIKSVSCAPNGTATHTYDATTGFFTVAISGLLTASDSITIELERETTTIGVSADANTTIALSGNSSFTTYASGTITTRIEETFNIVATPASGYEYNGYTINGWTSVATPTIGNDGKATFAVTVASYSASGNTFGVTSKQKAFTVNLTFNYPAYSADADAKPAEVTFTAGTDTLKTNADGGKGFVLVESATLSAPANSYYGVGLAEITSQTGGIASLTGSNGSFTLSNLASGHVINIKISYTKVQYNATFNASFGKSGDAWTAVKDVDGNNVTNTTSVITFTPRSYYYKDSITLSYSIVSQYYMFVGWYYENGTQISTANNATVTADAANMTFYGVVKGKTATATLSNGTILANYDGTANKYVNAGKDVNTGSKSLEYTYTAPTDAKAGFTVNAVNGYYLYKGIVHKADWAGVTNNALSGTAGTDYVLFDITAGATSFTSTGYGDLPTAVRDFIFNNPGCKIQFIGAQKAIKVKFEAGAGATGSSVEKTYYYGGANVSVSDIKTTFEKTGYTADGWEYAISGTKYTRSGEATGTTINEIVFGNEILSVVKASDYNTLTITRTYTANTYAITLNANGGTGGTASVSAVYDSTTSFTITNPTFTGHTFQGWTAQNDDTIVIDINGALVANVAGYTDANGKWARAEATTLYAKWGAVEYTITLDANGGTVENSTYTIAYGSKLTGLPTITRTGYTFDGWYYINGDAVTKVDGNTYFNSTNFPTGTYSTSGGDSGIKLYAKWTFDFTLDANSSVSIDYGTAITNQLGIKVTFNGTTKNIDSTSQVMPDGLSLVSFSWNPSHTGDTIYAPNIVNAGTTSVTLTITLSNGGVEKLRTTKDHSVVISLQIKQVVLTVYVNTPADQQSAIAANLKQLALDTNPILKLFNDTAYTTALNSGTWNALQDYVGTLTSSSVSAEQAWFYVVTKPMMAYKFMSKSDEAFSSAKFYTNTILKTMTYAEYLTKYSSAANLGITVGANNDYFAYAMQKYVSDSTALNIGLSGNIKTNAIVNGTSTPIPVSVVTTPNNGKVGAHSLTFRIDVSSITGFVAGNFSNLTAVEGSSNIYTLNVTAADITNNRIISAYVYRKPVVFTMTETTAIARTNPYTFTVTTDSYTATIKTTSGAAGTYRFGDGSLTVTSISPAIDANEFAYVDGEFKIINAPSTISFSSHLISASTDRTGIESKLIESPAGNPLENANNYYISIASVSVGGNSYAVTAGKEVYYTTSGDFVFQIINNGSLDPTIYAAAGSYTFKIAVASVNPATNRHLLEIVQWSSDFDYAGLLKGKTAFASGSYSKDLSTTIAENASVTFSAIYSEAAYVTIASSPDTAFNTGNYYVNFADTAFAVASASTNNAYTLNSWSSKSGSSTIATDGKVTLAEVPTETLTANYVLATPNVTVSAVTGNAKGTISFSTIASSNLAINNKDNSISYTYTWYKKSGSTYTAVTTLANSELSNGTYAVKVTASKTGYSAVTSDYVDFTITFSKLDISLTASATEATYNNSDFAASKDLLAITAEGGIEATYSVSDLLAENSKSDANRLFTVSLKKGSTAVSEMKNVGTYTLTIALFKSASTDNANYAKYLYNDLSKEFTFTIKAYEIPYDSYYNNTTAFSKAFREVDPALTLSLTLNNETVVVTYTRDVGEDVGSYDLKSASITNTNYVLVSGTTKAASITLPGENQRFTISKVANLKITAKAQVSGSLVYNNTTPTISAVAYTNNAWTFTITSGTQTVNITLSDLKEGTESVPAADVSSALSGLAFTFAESDVKNVGTYTLTTTWTSINYPGGFEFDGTAPSISITEAKIAYNTYKTTFSKFYGESDPALTNTLSLNGEGVTVTFTRVTGEKVEQYDLLKAIVGNTNYLLENDEGNYVAEATLTTGNKGFAINKRSALTLQFKLATTFVKTYDTVAPTITESATYASGEWSIKVGGTTIKLASINEKELSRSAPVDANTFAGVKFTLSATANVGEYNISASLTSDDNATYTAVELTNGTKAVKIETYKKELALSDLAIVSESFSKNYRGSDPDPISATAKLVGEETITIKFNRASGEDVGKYKLSIAEQPSGNYELSVPSSNTWFEIKEVSTSGISVNATNATITYNNQVPTITKGAVGTLTVSNGNSATITISNFAETVTGGEALTETQISNIWTSTTFTITDASKNVRTYTITATLNHKNYPAGMTIITGGTITINAATVAYDTYKKNFTKIYGASEPELVNSAVTGVNGETLTVNFTRASGTVATEKVGTYNLATATTTNTNYTLAELPTSNGLFTITERTGLTIEATITGSIKHTYNKVAADSTIAATFNSADNSYTLTVKGTDGSEWGTIKLSNFVEKAEGYNKSVTAYAGYLNGITFGITCDGSVGKCSITATGKTTDSQSTLTFANSAEVVEVEKLTVTLNKTNFVVGKAYGNDDVLTKEFTTSTNENITIAFTRTSGEAVGPYPVTTATTTNNNFNIVLATGDDAPVFTISKADAVQLTFSITGNLSRVYDKTAPNEDVTLSYNSTTKVYTISVYSGSTLWKTFTISNIKENGTTVVDVDADTFNGVTFKVSNPSANAGSYSIVATIDATKNDTYSTVELTGGANVISITPVIKTVAKSDFKTNNFTKVFRADDPETISGTLEYVTGDTITLNFSREAGNDVGNYTLTATNNTFTNYTLTIPADNDWFTITPVSGLTVSASASNKTITYTGKDITIEKAYADNAWALNILSGGVKIDSIALTAFKEDFETPKDLTAVANTLSGIEFALSTSAKNVDEYTITITGSNNNYPGGFKFNGTAPKLTIAPVKIDTFTKSLEKSFRSADPALTNEVNGVNNETVTITFTRDTTKQDVGTYTLLTATSSSANYVLKGGDGNYAQTVNLASNTLFEIKPVAGLKITAKANKNVTLTYLGKELTLETAFEDSTYVLKVKDGTTVIDTITLGLNTFKENFETPNSVTPYDGMLTGITFGFEETVKNVDVYTITATGTTTNYPGGFEFTDVAPTVTITKATITLAKDATVMTKVYGAADTTIQNQVTGVNGEKVTVVYTRDTANQKVGEYAITAAEILSTETTNVGNYTLSLPHNTDWFEITKPASLAISFELASGFTKVYDTAEVTISETATYASGKWTITVGGQTIELTNFKEGGSTTTITPDERTLVGVKFALSAVAKNAGEYTISASLPTAADNATYTSASIASTDKKVAITKYTKELALSDLTVVDNSFSKTFRTAEPTAIKATAKLVGNETLTLTFTRDTTNQDVGKYALTGVSITSGGEADNYELTLPSSNEWFEIEADNTSKITATATNVELTYNNQVSTITKGEVGTLTVSNGNSATITISNFAEAVAGTAATLTETQISEIWANTTFAITSASKNVGACTITATLNHKNYPAGMTLTGGTITINAKTITIPDSETPLFTKTYKDADPELVMTFTNITNSGILGSDSVKVTFTRTKNGETTEAVGKYALTNPVSANSNYTVKMAVENNRLFEIKRLEGLFITAEISGTTNSITYSGAQNYTVTSSYVEETGWTLTVSGPGITNATFTLSNLQAYDSTNEKTSAVSNISTALEGMTFEIDRAVKDVGNYTIIGKAETRITYDGITITNSLNVISVTAKSITVDATFSKNYGTASDGNLDMDYSHSTVDGIVSGDTVNVVFERAEGEKVGDHNLSIVSWDNENYNVTLGTNSKFTINKLSALELSFKVSGTFTKTYDSQTVLIGNEGQATWTGSKWIITVVSGTTSQTFDLIDFAEVELGNRTITPDETTLAGVTFSISGVPKDVGPYNITASLTGTNVTYTAVEGTVGENAVVINKLTKELALSELTVVSNSFSKTFRAAEPTITAKANPTGHEELTLTFARDIANQDVGTYDLTLTGGYSETNYVLTVPANNKWFEITEVPTSGISVNATAATITYNNQVPTITKGEVGTLTVSNGNSATITISNFAETVTGGQDLTETQIADIWTNTTFAIADAAKTEGDYTITATLNHKNYPAGMTITGGKVTISKATITIADSTTPLFTKTYRDADPTLSKEFVGVNGETVTVTFERATGVTANEKVGKHALTSASTTNANYTITLAKENSLFEIVRRTGMKLQATITGTYSKEYDATAISISSKATYADGTYTLTITGTEVVFTLSNFTEVVDETTYTAPVDANLLDGYTFSIQNASANKGIYTIVATGSDETYEGLVFETDKTVEITARAVELTSENFEIGKEYGAADNLTKSVSTDWGTFNATITRAEGEKVGPYNITGVTSDNANFAPSLSTTNAPKYVISRKSQLTLGFALKQVYTKTYDAIAVTLSNTATYAEDKWTITIGGQTYELTDFVEAELNNRAAPIDEKTLENVTFALSETAKNAGSYTIAATLAEDGNTTYTAISFTGGTNAVVINKLTKELAQSDLTVVDNSFSKTFRSAEPTAIKATAKLVGNETLTLTFARATGEDVGTYAVTLTGGYDTNNYELSIPANEWFSITKVMDSAITASADKETISFTYDGSIPTVSAPTFNASAKTWSIVVSNKAESATIVLSNFAETIESKYVLTDSDYAKLLNGITFKLVSASDNLVDAVAAAGSYKLIAVGESDNYPAGFAFIDGKNPTLTIAPVTITIEDGKPLFIKTYRSSDPELKTQYPGVNGETVEVIFTRDTTAADAERVGEHALASATTTDANYEIKLTSPNELFRIDRLEGLNIQGTITGTVVTREYNGAAAETNVSVTNNTDGTFTLKLTDGATEYQFTLKDLTEVGGGLENRAAPYFADMLDGITFSIEKANKNVGDYSITTAGSTNTYGKLVLAGDVKVMTITPAKITLEESKTQFSKVYGDDNTSLSLTLGHSDYEKIVDGETITVTFSRDAGESVGPYALKNAATTDNNYSIILDADNKWFTITKRENLVLKATLSGEKIEKIYNGLAPTIEFNPNGTITVKDSEMTWGTFALEGLTEYAAAVGEGEAFERTITLGGHTFKDLRFKIEDASKNAGTYSIVTDGAWTHDTYTTFEFVNASNEDVIKITPYAITLKKDEAAFTMTYGDTVETISNEINGVGSERIAVVYTREAGDDVRTYNIETATIKNVVDNANYTLTLPAENGWYEIKAYAGLKLAASADIDKLEFVYENAKPTIAQEVVDGALKLTITVGSTSKEIKLSAFNEKFAESKVVSNVEHALSGITFAIKDASKNVNETGYEIVAECTNANYPGGFAFDRTVPVIVITKAELLLKQENTSFSKIYNTTDAEAFPSGLVKTYAGKNGEVVTVTFTRSGGEDVGTYALAINTVSSTNYDVTIPENEWFEILIQGGLGITAEVDGDPYEIDYAGTRDFTIAAEFNTDTNKWTLVVYEDVSVVTRWELKNFNEVKDSAMRVITPKATTLEGLTFSINRTVKDKGTYTIIPSGTNKNYPTGFTFTGSADLIVVKAKQLTLSDIKKQFDQTTAFDSSVGNNTVTITGLVRDESVVVKGQFVNIGVGSDIEISGIEISGEYADNYTLASTTLTGSITKSELRPVIAVSKVAYTYGELTNGLSEIAATATIGGESVAEYITLTPSIEGATYSTGAFLNKGTYTLKITPTSEYYTVEDYTVEITVSALDITVYADGDINKVYDGDKYVEQSLTLETILESDVVTVSGAYETEYPGAEITVTFTLAGADRENYNLTNATTTGVIERAIIVVTAEINTVTFVDGAFAAGETSFEIGFPFENSASEVYDMLTQPTKTGYEFAGWKYGADKADLTVENISAVFGEALESKQLTIYADWTINTYTVTISIEDEQGSYVAVPEGEKSGNVHTYNYFDTITITSTAKLGYVALNSTQQIVNITENKNVSVDFKAAVITLNVAVDKSSLYPYGEAEISFGEGWTVASDGVSVSRTIEFTSLEGILAKEFLPVITIKGYTLTNWTSGEQVVATDATSTLKDVILALNNTFTNDISFDFTTSFTAKQYKISFIAGIDGENPQDIDVTYGQAVGTLPEVTKAGYDFGGWMLNGEEYTEDTIFARDEDITLTALWTAGVYDLTVNLTHATVSIRERSTNTAVVPVDGKYSLNRTIVYIITVTAEAGYRVSNLVATDVACEFDFNLEGDNAVGQIKNIVTDCEIAVSTEAKDNTFTVSIDHAQINVTVNRTNVLESATPEIGAEGDILPITFTAKTEQTVVIQVVADAGYDIALDTLNGAEFVKEGNTYTITGFTSNVTIAFESIAQQHTVTFILGNGVTGTSEYHGAEKQSETTYIVTTDREFSFALSFAYGYEFNAVTANPEMTIANEDGIIAISGFTDDFTVTISAKKKTFDINAYLYALDQEGNIKTTSSSFHVDAPVSAEFESTATFVASKDASVQGYRFIGWFEGELDIIDEGKVVYDINNLVSENLTYERMVDGNITVTAVFQYAEFEVKAYIDGEGEGQIKRGDVVVADSADNSYMREMLFYGTNLSLTAVPKEGYKFSYWMINDVRKDLLSEEISNYIIEEAVEFKAVFEPLTLDFQIAPIVSINGVRYSGNYITDLAYGSMEWGTYDKDTGIFTQDERDNGVLPLTITTLSGVKIYVKIVEKAGYTFDGLSNNAGTIELVTNKIDGPTQVGDDMVYIYEISGMNAVNAGRYGLTAVFIAKSSKVTIVYKDAETQVDAGRIEVEVHPGIAVSGNSTSNVVVDVVTGKTLNIVASARFGSSFVLNEGGNYQIEAEGLTVADITSNMGDADLTKKGFAERISFKLSGFTGDPAEIVIYVQSTTYKVNLVAYDEENNSIYSETVEEVKVGQTLNLSGIEMPVRTGYSFAGFYTYLAGAGKQYVNADGEVVATWAETGYSWNGVEYVQDSNYDPATKQFTLYASFIIDKTRFEIDAVPPALKGTDPTVAARVVITSLNEANSWTTADDIFMAEVLYGADVNIKAPFYEGYRFANWKIVKTDAHGTVTTDISTEETITTLNHSGYPLIQIYAVYDALISIEGNEGGNIYFTYTDRSGMERTVYDEAYVPTSSSIYLHAEAENGYDFVGWTNANGEVVSTAGVFEITASEENHLTAASFTAKFKGKDVKLFIGEYDTTPGRIVDITIDGLSQGADSSVFNVNIGSKIVFYVEKSANYELIFNGAEVNLRGEGYVYIVKYSDIDPETYSLTLTPVFTQLACDVEINVKLIGDGIKENELPLAGTVRYFDTEGNKIAVAGGTITFSDKVGRELVLEVVPSLNYKIASIMYGNQDVTGQIVAGRLSIPLAYIRQDIVNEGGKNVINIEFQRDMWTDLINEEHKVNGEGNRSNPYLIGSAEDFAFVAYMVNVIKNGNYTNAYYKLTSDINLAGRYWSPIGTAENPFNGTFDFDVFAIEDVAVVYGYEGDLDATKAFGYLGPDAKFTEANQELMIILIVAGSVVGLTAIALIVFLVLRRKRRKKLEELQNS